MFTEEVYLYNFGYVFLIQVIFAVVFSLILLYSWPLNISFDPENRLPLYYPCSCKYWSGGYKRRAVPLTSDSQVDDIREQLIDK